MNWNVVLKGMAMGVAEVIPGVSGGTIAFITGIYERLLRAIKSVSPSLIGVYKQEGWSGIWKAVDGRFLTFLLLGMAGGFIIGVFVITWLLEVYPEPLWAFFFGLILASSVFIAREMDSWNLRRGAVMLMGVMIAYAITVMTPSGGSTHPVYLFFSGFLAISALILPGISGSFILLLLGMYTIIIPAIKHFIQYQGMEELKLILLFGTGCLVGLAGFSRILTWLFKHYKNSVFALLTGFMIGSLNKIWPWRNMEIIMSKETGMLTTVSADNLGEVKGLGEYKILSESNVWPSDYWMGNPHVLWVIVAFLAGLFIVFLLDRNRTAKEKG